MPNPDVVQGHIREAYGHLDDTGALAGECRSLLSIKASRPGRQLAVHRTDVSHMGNACGYFEGHDEDRQRGAVLFGGPAT